MVNAEIFDKSMSNGIAAGIGMVLMWIMVGVVSGLDEVTFLPALMIIFIDGFMIFLLSYAYYYVMKKFGR